MFLIPKTADTRAPLYRGSYQIYKTIFHKKQTVMITDHNSVRTVWYMLRQLRLSVRHTRDVNYAKTSEWIEVVFGNGSYRLLP